MRFAEADFENDRGQLLLPDVVSRQLSLGRDTDLLTRGSKR
jgi:hypothetical protein